MKINKADYNEDSINAIAVLLEFYDQEMLGRFCEICRGYDSDTTEAFIVLKEILMKYLAVAEEAPDFTKLATMYAEKKGIKAVEFSKLL